jgi:hypothetical protein
MGTRRCTQRQFFLAPCEETRQAILYCLAEAAAKHHIDVLWIMACSNHLHYGLLDRGGNYPDFLRRFHQHVSKVINCHWGRWGKLFDGEQTSMVELADDKAVFREMMYSLTNPVKDHLVQRAQDWTGATSLHHQLDDEELVVAKPGWFFRQGEDSKLPEVVRLRFKRPPPFEHLSHKEWKKMITHAVDAQERASRDERRLTKRRVLGIHAVQAQPFHHRPKSHEPRRRMSPRVAAKNKWRRIETLQRNHAFLKAYAAARREYRAGNADAVFPAGTYLMRVQHSVRCAPA